MPIYIDPQTRQRIVYQADCTDITYLASQSDSAITSESVPLIGPGEIIRVLGELIVVHCKCMVELKTNSLEKLLH